MAAGIEDDCVFVREKQFTTILNRYSLYCKKIVDANGTQQNNSKEFLERIMNNFLKAELQYIQLLENLKNDAHSKHLDLEFGILSKIFITTESKLFPDLSNVGTTISKVVNSFLRQVKLFEVDYKLYLSLTCNSKNRSSWDKIDFLKLSSKILINRLYQYIDLLQYSKNLAEPDLIPFIRYGVSTIQNVAGIGEFDLRIREEIAKIVQVKEAFIHKLSHITTVVIPKVSAQKRYKNKVHLIAGKSEDILKKEQNCYMDLTECLDDNNANKTGECLMNHECLLDLYIQDARTRIDQYILKAFCIANKENEELFNIIPTHLFRIKNSLEKLMKLCERHGNDANKLKEAIYMIEKTLKKLDDWKAVSEIVGLNVQQIKLGDILLRNRFKIKSNTEVFQSMVFLFEERLIFTVERRLTDEMLAFEYRKDISLSDLGIGITEKHFKVFSFAEGYNKSLYSIYAEDDESLITKWTQLIEERLLKKMNLIRQEYLLKNVNDGPKVRMVISNKMQLVP